MEAGPRVGALTTHRDQLPSTSQYELLLRIASGGMATVYVGRRTGAAGFSREVAIKRAHAHLLEDPAFAKMLVAEAKIAARIHHPNVVAVQAVELLEGELLLVMDYVEGAALSELAPLVGKARRLPTRVAIRIVIDAAHGLHAAHIATDERGEPLGLVHRDVSPQNILIGVDGVARVSDFGIAKSTEGESSIHGKTATGTLKGKVAYMAPEYVDGGRFDLRSDVFALGVVAWETLTGQRLFRGANEVETLKQVLVGSVTAPSRAAPEIGTTFDAVVLRALARRPQDRWESALAFADALEDVARSAKLLASASEVGDVVRAVAGPSLSRRRALIQKRPEGESSVRVIARAEATGTLDQIVVTESTEVDQVEPPESEPPRPPPPESPESGIAPSSATGVSSRSVSADEATGLPRSSGRAVVAVVAVLFGVGALAAAGLASRRAPSVVPPAVATAPESSTSPVPLPSATAPIETSPPPQASVSEVRVTASPSSSSSAPPSRTSPPRGRPRGRTPDRAPPNPYGE